MEPDFSGYASKANIRCADGRTIMPEAFKHMHQKQVPLVWQHSHGNPDNVLGHAILEARSDGVYAYGYFNNTKQGLNGKALVQHGDINSLSIYANGLVEKSKQVFHGDIREVSLVLAGANPGARIENISIQHSDGGVEVLDEDVVIYSGAELEHTAIEDDEEFVEHADTNPDMTVQDIYDTMTPEQKDVLHFMIGAALENASGGAPAQHSATNDEGDLEDQEGTDTEMTHNVFENNGQGAPSSTGGELRHNLTPDDMKELTGDAVRLGSLRAGAEAFIAKHGISSIDLLFPDAKTIGNTPEFNQRRTEWVAAVLNGTRHSPFAKVKTITADITQDEARAKGYIKGNMKKEEWFGLSKRQTSPTTVYKKQKLDRDDMIDITDFDVVAWLKGEMRLLLEEELARAILIGDGRDVSSEDKIKDPIGASDGQGIRSILNEHELFASTVYVNVDDANSTYDEVIDHVLDGFELFKGTGTPVFYTTIRTLNKFLKIKDSLNRRIYPTKADVASALNVRDIVTVEAMNDVTDLIGIIVDLQDYTVGSDKGGEMSLFDDFDIDYNQYKYLLESRLSGALTKIKSAIIVKKVDSTLVEVTPTVPSYNPTTGVVTIPTKTGVTYKNSLSNATLTAGAQTAISVGSSLSVKAVPASGYFFPDNGHDEWIWTRS